MKDDENGNKKCYISYAKHKVKASYFREKEIERQLGHLDSICNNFFSAGIDHVLRKPQNRIAINSLDREWRASNKIFFLILKNEITTNKLKR